MDQPAGGKTATEITYTLNRDDLVAFSRWVRKRRVGNRPWRATVVVTIFAMGYAIYFYRNMANKGAAIVGIGIMFVVPAVVVPIVLRILWWSMDRQAAAGISEPAAPASCVTRLSKANVFHRGISEETATSWKAVREVAMTDRHIFLLAGEDRGVIVPSSAFGSPGEASQFYETARSHWQRAAKQAKRAS